MEGKKARIIDFHSHVLPAIDDGAKSTDMSLAIMEETRRQKVRKMVATPHFYPHKMPLKPFIEKRDEAVGNLMEVWDPETCPRLFLGTEVGYFPSLSESQALDDLTIRGTNTILIEMPFRKWSDTETADILDTSFCRGFKVILAHIERYLEWQSDGIIEKLVDGGIYIQSNAEHFVQKKTRKRALEMVERGWIHILGSDTHNTSTRPQEIGSARDIIREELGEERIAAMLEVSKTLLDGAISLDEMI